MELIKLFSEIQQNPNNINAIRKIIKFYEKHKMKQEAQAFQYLLEIKYESDNTNCNKE